MMESRLKIKSYTPEASSYSPRIRNEQWDKHKSLLKHLHDEGYKRADMLEILRKQNFTPSIGQLNAKMTGWGFKVYGTQSDLQEEDSENAMQMHSFDATGTHVPEVLVDSYPTSSPTSHRSMSLVTLCDPPKTTAELAPLDATIVLESLSLAGSYWPSAKPSDYGFKSWDRTDSTKEAYYRSIMSVAEFLSAVHCFEQAFDLYHHILVHSTAGDLVEDGSIVRGLVRCALSATTNEQCAYVLPLLRRAQLYCIEHDISDLSICFASLSEDLGAKKTQDNHDFFMAQKDPEDNCPLLLATSINPQPVTYQKAWFKQQLSECDDRFSTLSNLSFWCQDTLSFYRLEDQVIVRSPTGMNSTEIDNCTAVEHDFQILVSALVIDYLNSPGPSMKQTNIDCKERECLFRSALPPITSLIVMAHLMFEPLLLQSQTTTNTYLHARAQSFAMLQSTTALQELKSFTSAESHVRCSAFVDTFLKHFHTSLAYRQFVSRVSCFWDRKIAAKRLAQILQSNQDGLPSHAGLPASRRSVIKNLAAPFPHDPSLTESRPSTVSESGSLSEFTRLAHQVRGTKVAGGSMTPSDAMSIDTRSSWSFHQVTGFSQGPTSHRTSLSSRRGVDQDEMDEYRNFIRDNNYTNQVIQSYAGTSMQ